MSTILLVIIMEVKTKYLFYMYNFNKLKILKIQTFQHLAFE